MTRYLSIALLLLSVLVAEAAAPGFRYRYAVPPSYFLRDEFTDTRTSLNGTAATPGPNSRVAVDSESKLTDWGNALSFAGGKASPAMGDPGIWYPSLTRNSGGAMLLARLAINFNTGPEIGWDSNQSGSIPDDDLYFAGGGEIDFVNNSSQAKIGTYSQGTVYAVTSVLRGRGSYLFIKGGAYTSPTLLYQLDRSSTATMYPAVANYNAFANLDYIRVTATNTWMPPVSAYDSFTRANYLPLGSTESSGPDGQIVSSLAWSGSSWGILSGIATNNPGATTNSLLTVVDTGKSNVIVQCRLQIAAGNAGIVLNYASDQNYVLVRYGGGNVHLDKCVNGTVTADVINVAKTYSANARLIAMKDGTTYAVWYNDSLCGTFQTINDASLVQNTRHGMFSDNTGNYLGPFTVLMRGTDSGEFSALNYYHSASGSSLGSAYEVVSTNATVPSLSTYMLCGNSNYLYGIGPSSYIVACDASYNLIASNQNVGYSPYELHATSSNGLILDTARDANYYFSLFRTTNFGVNWDNVATLGDDGGNAVSNVYTMEKGFCECSIGGSNVFLLGEYNVNGYRSSGSTSDKVRILQSFDLGATWSTLVTFNVGSHTMRHIHAIRQDPTTGYIYICCGDLDAEAAIIRWDGTNTWDDNLSYATLGARTGFKVLSGSQRYRTIDMLFTTNFCHWAVDDHSSAAYTGIWRSTKALTGAERVDDKIWYLDQHDGWGGVALGNGRLLFTTTATAPSGDPTMRIYTSADEGGSYGLAGAISDGDISQAPYCHTFAVGTNVYLSTWSAGGTQARITFNLFDAGTRSRNSGTIPLILP